MRSATFPNRLLRTVALGSLLTSAAFPALAQQTTEEVIQVPQAETAPAPQTEKITVTGSRIATDSYTSSSPMTVVTADEAAVQGVVDIATLLQNSVAAAGSSQVTAAISSALAAPPGGIGTQTIGLRGLGAQRTLVLLNGRRAGPAGTGGTVGPFDLNVIPLSAVQSIEILKDGASSIYGSDAIAGVVNIITKKDTGGSIDFSFTRPEVSDAGQEMQVSATYGKDFGNGYFRITADYFEQTEFDRGDRDFFDCSEQYLFNPDGSRADLVDPRTGKYQCRLDSIWGHNWVYNYTGTNATKRPWRSTLGFYQYDHLGNLGQYVPAFGAQSIPDPSGLITPAGWYPVNYNTAAYLANPNLDPVFSQFAQNSAAVTDYFHPMMNAATLSPNIERMSVFADGEFDINDSLTVYGEVLLNRRKTHDDGYTQFYSFQYLYTAGDGVIYGDPVAQDAGWSLRTDGRRYNLAMSPTGLSDNADESVEVDYTRFVGGLRGDLGDSAPGWTWDVAAQFSRSHGEYSEQFLWADANEDYQLRTDYCANVDNGAGMGLTRYRGIPCVDINWYSPSIMFGDLTAQEEAFLFGNTTSWTTYEQSTVEGFIAGPLFDLPAGSLDVVFGFLYQHDDFHDQPSQEWIDGEVSSGVGGVARIATQGSDVTNAAFMEASIPILKDLPFFQSLDLSASGRYTEVRSYGGDDTYKLGLNWQINDDFRLRANKGTSFRTPGLYELYLARQQSGLYAQGNDPCAMWADKLALNTITQRQAQNCAMDPKAGGAIGGDQLLTAGIQARVYRNGGLGTLGAETSTSEGIGLVWTPSFADLSISVDYFDIQLSGEVGTVSAGYIVNGCYDSANFPNDPLCTLFTRYQPGEGAASQLYTLAEINTNFLNISEQSNRGIDIEARYGHETPWGDLNFDLKLAKQLESGRILQPGSPVEEENGQAGEPEWVGQLNTSFNSGPFSVFWGVRYVGATSEFDEYWSGRTTGPTFLNRPVDVVLGVPPTWYHALSFGYELEDLGVTARFGVRNLFNQEPPRVSSAAPDYLTLGGSVIESQYDVFGRTYFLNVSKTF
jgi:iron complex outermembrane receptor protein